MVKKNVITLLALMASSPLMAAEGAIGAQTRSALSLNVYQSDFAVITESRKLKLPPGKSEAVLTGLPETLRADTLLIDTPSFNLTGLDFTPGNLSVRKLLKENIGNEATLVFTADDGYIRKRGILLFASNEAVWDIEGKIVSLPLYSGQGSFAWYEFDSLPKGAKGAPTLTLSGGSPGGLSTLSFAYQTDGIGWSADYNFLLENGSYAGDLEGWARITNRTQGEFEKAKVSLVAGTVRRQGGMVYDDRPRALAKAAPSMAMAESMDVAPVKSSEYYVYELPGVISLGKESEIRKKLLTFENLEAKRELRLFNHRIWYGNVDRSVREEKPQFYLTFLNDRETGPGKPLPEGTVRVYVRTDSGIRLIGEDLLVQTPVGKRAELHLGEAFDISSKRQQLEYDKIDNYTAEALFEIVFINGGRETEIKVRESLNGEWKILEANHPHEKINSSTEEFTVKLPRLGEAKLRYKARLRSGRPIAY